MAGQHPASLTPASADRRRFRRIATRIEARIVFAGVDAECLVHEMSATGAIVELDLAKALRDLPDEQRGWDAAKRTVQCQSCKAVSVFDPGRVGQNCDFCGSPALVDYQEIKAPIRPQGVLPFKVDQGRVREQMRDWFRGRWFAPNNLGSKALVDRVHGVYVPYWTFDAHAVCPWTAEAGHYYYTTERYRDNQGRSRTRQVRHVRPLDLLRPMAPYPLASLAARHHNLSSINSIAT